MVNKYMEPTYIANIKAYDSINPHFHGNPMLATFMRIYNFYEHFPINMKLIQIQSDLKFVILLKTQY